MVKLKLESVVNTGIDGNPVKDRDGSLTYIRYDAVALSQLLNAVNSKTVSIGEYKTLITLDDKSREGLKAGINEIELAVEEAVLLKKLLSAPQNDGISFSLFHIRTISAILEQLK